MPCLSYPGPTGAHSLGSAPRQQARPRSESLHLLPDVACWPPRRVLRHGGRLRTAPRRHPRQSPRSGPSCHDHLSEAGRQRQTRAQGTALRPARREGSSGSANQMALWAAGHASSHSHPGCRQVDARSSQPIRVGRVSRTRVAPTTRLRTYIIFVANSSRVHPQPGLLSGAPLVPLEARLVTLARPREESLGSG